jgi:hypothetical protein
VELSNRHGFGTDLWTLERVGEVIRRQTGKRYHPGHVWRILRRMGWSLQRPARRAAERDEKAVRRWKKDRWPKIVRNARRRGAWICCLDESGVSLQPPVRRTWAPRGRTPTIVCPFNWKRASLVAATCYRPDGSEAELCFGLRPRPYNDEALIDFLSELHRHLGGGKATVVWDGLPSHRSRKMRRFVRTQRHWLVVEQLPAYAPELNPVEAAVGQPQGPGARSPVGGDPGRGDRYREARTPQDPPASTSAVRVPPSLRPFFVAGLLPHYANFFRCQRSHRRVPSRIRPALTNHRRGSHSPTGWGAAGV